MSTKTLKIVLALTLTAFAGYIYLHPPGAREIIPTITAASICNDYDTDAMSTLDADLIRMMTEGYRKNQLNYIQGSTATIAPTDAQAIWFDLETLKKYLYHIERNAKKVNPSITDATLGLRIYYATYPDSTQIKDFTDLDFMKDVRYSKYSGLHTLVMIPTLTNSEGKTFDFNPLDKETFNGFKQDDKYSASSTSSSSDATAALTVIPSGRVAGRNHGNLYPPGNISEFGF